MIVLDANILIRAVLGRGARYLIETYHQQVRLIVADTAVAEARWHLSELAVERRLAPGATAELLERTVAFAETVEPEMYSAFGDSALERLFGRDPDDWPSLALCMALDCPIWTEDRDFFGVGVATWTTGHVEIFLKQQTNSAD